jgi:hypothetical protein
MEYLTSRGLRSLLSSHQFKNGQDKYQFPTAVDSTEAHAMATAFAVGCDYWSAIYVDEYYYTSLSCVAEQMNDRSILFYLCFPTYGMASQCTVDQLYLSILTCLISVQTPKRKVLESLLHMY